MEKELLHDITKCEFLIWILKSNILSVSHDENIFYDCSKQLDNLIRSFEQEMMVASSIEIVISNNTEHRIKKWLIVLIL